MRSLDNRDPKTGRMLPVPISERFWDKVKKGDGCWEWQGKRQRGNRQYGIAYPVRHKPVAAHRLAWELTYGSKIPKELDACHSCDNPPCVRPDHIFIGTRTHNMRDAARKGRTRAPCGESNPFAKLTEANVIEMRTLAASGVGQRELARKYGLCHRNIGKIVRGEKWAHVPMPRPAGEK